ncbi:MAG: helix-turn-helix transcriptional regulator [Acidimicrobiia bacterium]
MNAGPTSSGDEVHPGWTLLTNHGHVLVCIVRDPDILVSDIASQVGIRERAAHRILTELIAAGYVTRTKHGRQNHYSVRNDRPMRHPLERAHQIGELLRILA